MNTTDPDVAELQRLFDERFFAAENECWSCHKVDCDCDEQTEGLRELERENK